MKERGEKLLHDRIGKIPLPALLVLVFGCLLMLIPVGSQQAAEEDEKDEGTLSVDQFERRLESVLSEIDGAGKTMVILSVESGSRMILAQDRSNSSTGISMQTITVGGAGNQQVVPIQTMAPAFRGALIVCSGAADAQVKLEITKAVSILTGLGTDRICVSAGIT